MGSIEGSARPVSQHVYRVPYVLYLNMSIAFLTSCLPTPTAILSFLREGASTVERVSLKS